MKIAIRSKQNQRYLSAEYGGGISDGLALTANREEVLGYETFEEIKLSNGYVAIKTYNGTYLTADVDGSLRTNATEIGWWENFKRTDSFIETAHGLRLTNRIDKDLCPIETTENTGGWEEFEFFSLEPSHKREGLVGVYGRSASDAGGMFHPLGLTFMWALYGWKFERERIVAHLDWLKQFNLDYLRILGEVNWPGRSIDPNWPDYQDILSQFVDFAYDEYGIRSEVTITGGQYQRNIENKVVEALDKRAHKVIHYEVCNEWERLDKISKDDMIRVGKFLRDNTPNLVSLSTPSDNQAEIIAYTKQAGANMYTPHLRRSDHDAYWSHVRQGYDMKNFPAVGSNNEPQGPQSSVKSLSNPMQLAMARATGIVCGGSFYVLHVGQGVTGVEDPDHGRPQNMWEVSNIDAIINHVRGVDEFLPRDIENWKVVNNSRDDHPMPLDPDIGDGFWEGNSSGSVNKNFACISGDRFVEVLLGVNHPETSGATKVGKVKRNSRIVAHNITDFSSKEIFAPAGSDVHLTGRSDKMMGYIVHGNL
jgi:hypothetical protein